MSIFFVQTTGASFYSDSVSKNNFVMNPRMMQYKQQIRAIGGADFKTSKGVLIPAYSVVESDINTKEQNLGNDAVTSYYIVQPGDNVSKIANKFGVKKETIIFENNLNSKGFLKVGQKISILMVDGLTYKIKKGDTLDKIAKRYLVKSEDIREFNKLQEDYLKIGSEIIIPNATIPKDIIKKSKNSKKTGKNGKKAVHKKTSKYIWIRTTDGRRVKHKAWVPTRKIRYTRRDYGYFTHPMPGSVRTQGLHGRNAIDMSAPIGAPILAAHSGVIKKAYKYGYGGGYGRHVIINHGGGVETLYAHMRRVIVNNGQKVVKGQIIGYEGSTGRSTGAHLHFEVHGRKNPF